MKIKQFKSEFCRNNRTYEHTLVVDINGVSYGSSLKVPDFDNYLPRHVILERLTDSIGREISRNLFGMIA